jgi:hypothetical protein
MSKDYDRQDDGCIRKKAMYRGREDVRFILGEKRGKESQNLTIKQRAQSENRSKEKSSDEEEFGSEELGSEEEMIQEELRAELVQRQRVANQERQRARQAEQEIEEFRKMIQW